MGTEIHLKIGDVTLDWSKNSIGTDHGCLFQEGDRTQRPSDQIDYEYCRENDIDTSLMERALSRPLRSIVMRLELLGWTLEMARVEYEVQCKDSISDFDTDVNDESSQSKYLSFSDFLNFLRKYPIASLENTFTGHSASAERDVSKKFSGDPDFYRIPNQISADGYSEASYFGALARGATITGYALLRLLAEVPENLDLDVVWQYGPLVDSGWAAEGQFVPGATRQQTFLIATEGSSDVHILKHAIALLLPDVQDFFRFIDVSERHPFSGTGSLVKFAEGLIKIDVQNNLLFIFDNDAEGWSAYEEVSRYKMPSNMRTMVLPDIDDFKNFNVFGPEGDGVGNINQRAAAIECYLDLNLENGRRARVTWTNYKEKLRTYQGSLEFKDHYMRNFLAQTKESVNASSYDFSKIQKVLKQIFSECQKIYSLPS